jgi:apolipoprotein N-acyltransferase
VPYSSTEHFKPGTELVIFPESALWGNRDENEVFFSWAEDVLKDKNIYLLVGQYAHDGSKEIWTNSLILYDEDLKEQGRYDEIHPVPFSQYMPYPEILGFLTFLDFSIVNLVPGDSYEPVSFKERGSLGFSICYESTLPYISRKFRDRGAELIIVASDDSSLNESIAPRHHLIFSKTRAIENGCYVVHCANTGFSAIISPAGNLVEKIDLMDKDVMYGTVYLLPDKTFYSSHGNILLYIYLALSAMIAIAYPLWRRRKIKKPD